MLSNPGLCRSHVLIAQGTKLKMECIPEVNWAEERILMLMSVTEQMGKLCHLDIVRNILCPKGLILLSAYRGIEVII